MNWRFDSFWFMRPQDFVAVAITQALDLSLPHYPLSNSLGTLCAEIRIIGLLLLQPGRDEGRSIARFAPYGSISHHLANLARAVLIGLQRVNLW